MSQTISNQKCIKCGMLEYSQTASEEQSKCFHQFDEMKKDWILPKKYKFIADEFPDFEKDYKKDLDAQRHSIIEEIIENVLDEIDNLDFAESETSKSDFTKGIRVGLNSIVVIAKKLLKS